LIFDVYAICNNRSSVNGAFTYCLMGNETLLLPLSGDGSVHDSTTVTDGSINGRSIGSSALLRGCRN